jgi:Lrp/AsnC family transcriptional regulator, leucine-responsive regulatory protein
MHLDKLDQIDIKILEIIQSQARIKRKDLAESVHLTIPAVSERMRKMEDEGYVAKYTAILNPKKVNLGVAAFIFVDVESSSHYNSVIQHAQKYDEILECHAITGSGSHLLKIRTVDVDHLERLLVDIQSWEGVKHTKTNLILSSPKETTELNLTHLEDEITKKQ